tara:strand:+ start:877 stop:1002 length:126 start_codon:yes stop_codon:yes gene_type:complete
MCEDEFSFARAAKYDFSNWQSGDAIAFRVKILLIIDCKYLI